MIEIERLKQSNRSTHWTVDMSFAGLNRIRNILNANYDMTTKSRDANIINLELGTVSHSLSMDRFFFFLGSWFGHIHYMCVSICDGEREREREPESSSIQSSPYHITSQSDFQSTECNWCRNIVSLLLFLSTI